MKQYKNSKGEDLPKEINEVVNAESQRLVKDDRNTDKLHGAFTQGEIVEVRDSEGQKWAKREYVSEYKGCHICFNENTFFTKCVSWKEIRKIQPLELTLPELLTIAESVKGTKVILKS